MYSNKTCPIVKRLIGITVKVLSKIIKTILSFAIFLQSNGSSERFRDPSKLSASLIDSSGGTNTGPNTKEGDEIRGIISMPSSRNKEGD